MAATYKTPWWVWGLMGVAGVIAVANIEKPKDEPQAVQAIAVYDQDNSIDALFMMQRFVKGRLKSPSSAEFPNPYDRDERGTIVRKEGQRYFITSWVEALNPFGVRIRTQYAGRVLQVDRGNWQLIELEFIR